MQSEKKSLCPRAWPGCRSLPLAWMLLQHAEASGGCSCCAGLTGPTLTLPRACRSRGPTATLSPTLGLRMGKRVSPGQGGGRRDWSRVQTASGPLALLSQKMPCPWKGPLAWLSSGGVSRPRSKGHGGQTSTFPEAPGFWVVPSLSTQLALGLQGRLSPFPSPFSVQCQTGNWGEPSVWVVFFKAAWVRGRP